MGASLSVADSPLNSKFRLLASQRTAFSGYRFVPLAGQGRLEIPDFQKIENFDELVLLDKTLRNGYPAGITFQLDS